MSMSVQNDAAGDEPPIDRDLRRARGAAGFCALVFTGAYFLPSMLRQNVYTDDMSEWTAWAYSFADPNLFHNDVIKTYWTANFPFGYRLVLQALAPLVDAELLGKLLGLLLGALTIVLSYRLGGVVSRTVSGRIVTLVLVPLCQFSPFGPLSFLNREAGGLPRGFALPVMLFGVIAAFRNDMRLVGSSLIAAALFYPPACVMLGTYVGLLIMVDLAKRRTSRAGLPILLATSAVAVCIVLASGLSSRSITGPLYTLEQMRQMPEFYPGGIAGYFFHDHWWDYLVEIFQLDAGLIGFVWLLFVSATFALGFALNDPKLIRKEMLLLPISAIVNYGVAYIVLLRMFEPSRYLLFPMQVLTICCMPLMYSYVFERVIEAVVRSDMWRRRNKALSVAGVAAVTMLGLAVFAIRVALDRGGLDPLPPELYAALNELPTGTPIAATPTDGDRIPMHSRRSALLIKASLFPYHPYYYDEMKQRFLAILQARYDPSPAAVQILRQRYGVRYYLYDNNDRRQDHFAELHPFDRDVARLVAAQGNKTSYLSGLAKTAALVRVGDYSILDLDRSGP